MDNLIEVNPFTNEFVKGEIEFMQYDVPDSGKIEYRGLTLKFAEIRGRCDDYLNKNMRFDDWLTPIMFIDGELWMSLSSMEIQSAFFGWWGMNGDVAMLGLGTGYTALKCSSNPDVDRVVVYEQDERMVEFFQHLHSNHPNYGKLEFVIGDARETFKDKSFDCVFADIYQTMLCDEVVTDIDLFHEQNKYIGWYRFWAQELVQLIALNEEMMPTYALSMIDLDYLRHWQTTDESKMYGNHIEVPYVHNLLHVIGSHPESMYLDSETFNDDYCGEDEYYG
jgi:hypothetical protein